MSLPTIVLRFDRGFASFKLRLEATAGLGKHFECYRQLLELGPAAALHAKEHDPPTDGSEIVFHCSKVRELTDNQLAMLNWLVSNQGVFVDFLGPMIRFYYSSPRWLNWQLGDFIGRQPPPPVIPTGYALENFLRITNIVLNPQLCSFGVAVAVAWSEDCLGVRFDEFQAVLIGSDSVSLL